MRIEKYSWTGIIKACHGLNFTHFCSVPSRLFLQKHKVKILHLREGEIGMSCGMKRKDPTNSHIYFTHFCSVPSRLFLQKHKVKILHLRKGEIGMSCGMKRKDPTNSHIYLRNRGSFGENMDISQVHVSLTGTGSNFEELF